MIIKYDFLKYPSNQDYQVNKPLFEQSRTKFMQLLLKLFELIVLDYFTPSQERWQQLAQIPPATDFLRQLQLFVPQPRCQFCALIACDTVKCSAAN